MCIAAMFESLPGAVWALLILLGFILWWPLGLALLAYALWRGKMRCCGGGFGLWNDRAGLMGRAQEWWRQVQTTGNRSFDDYRTETLRRLEEEEREFRNFVERLRRAKDKAEFEQFMAERRAGPAHSAPD